MKLSAALARCVGARMRRLADRRLKKSRELLHGESGLSDERSKRSLGQILVVGYGEAPVRWLGMPEDHVAAVLLIEFVAKLSKCLDRLAATGSFIRRRPR